MGTEVAIKDRIVAFKRVPAGDLAPHPLNPRTHPKEQREAMAAALDEIGYADALVVRKTGNGYQILDGHLRAVISPGQDVPVLVVDLDDEEARKFIATHDPLTALAEINDAALIALVEGLDFNNEALANMVDQTLGKFTVASEGGMPDLPDGDREPFQQMTFVLSDDQAEKVKSAIGVAKQAGRFVDTINENSNGNALARIVEHYLGSR